MSQSAFASRLNSRGLTRHHFVYNTTVDMKGGTGDIIAWPVPYEKIQIETIGWTLFTAGGAITTAAVMQVDKQLRNNGARAILNALATLTFDNSLAIYMNQQAELDTGASNTPIAGPPSYPTAVRGDVIVFERTTQGVGGGSSQDVRVWMIFREIPA